MNLTINQINSEFYNKLMPEWLENNDIFIFLTYNKGKSVITERFIRTLKAKIYKKMTGNDSKTYLSYLNKTLDQYNNTYHHYINKKPINADYSALTEPNETNSKAPKFEVFDGVRIAKYKIFLLKVTLKICQEKYLLLILFRKLILRYKKKNKDLNGKKII